jgi:lactoylglutathione lyase
MSSRRGEHADGRTEGGFAPSGGGASLNRGSPYAEHLDEVEVGTRVAGHIRVCFEVDDTRAATDDLVDAGARLIAPPTVTPWDTLNSRLEAPAGLQLTLFGPVTDDA